MCYSPCRCYRQCCHCYDHRWYQPHPMFYYPIQYFPVPQVFHLQPGKTEVTCEITIEVKRPALAKKRSNRW